MKPIITLFIALNLGFISLAQDLKVNTIQKAVILVVSVNENDTDSTSNIEIATENKVARLYKFKNSRIKKALAFKTKRNKAKAA